MNSDQPNKIQGQKFFVKSRGIIDTQQFLKSPFDTQKMVEKSPTDINSSQESTVFSQSRRFLSKSNKNSNASRMQSFFQKQENLLAEIQQQNRQKFFTEVIEGQSIEQNKRNVQQLKRTLRIKSQVKQYQPFTNFEKSVMGREDTYMNFMVPSAQRTSGTQFALFPSSTRSNSIPLVDLWSQKQIFQLQLNQRFTKEQYCVRKYIQQKKLSDNRKSKQNCQQTQFLNKILDKIYQKYENQKENRITVKTQNFGDILQNIQTLNSDSIKLHQEFSKLQIINEEQYRNTPKNL